MSKNNEEIAEQLEEKKTAAFRLSKQFVNVSFVFSYPTTDAHSSSACFVHFFKRKMSSFHIFLEQNNMCNEWGKYSFRIDHFPHSLHNILFLMFSEPNLFFMKEMSLLLYKCTPDESWFTYSEKTTKFICFLTTLSWKIRYSTSV